MVINSSHDKASARRTSSVVSGSAEKRVFTFDKRVSPIEPESLWWAGIPIGNIPACVNKSPTQFIEPDSIPTPKILLNTMKDKPPTPKKLANGNCAELDYDYGTAMTLEPDFSLSDSESVVEAMAISIDTDLKTEVIEDWDESHESPKEMVEHVRQGRAYKSYNSQDSRNSNKAEQEEIASLQNNLSRNKEYFENLRKCYDLDIVSPCALERSRSEESMDTMLSRSSHCTPSSDNMLSASTVFHVVTPVRGGARLFQAGSTQATPTRERMGRSLKRSFSAFDFKVKNFLHVDRIMVSGELSKRGSSTTDIVPTADGNGKQTKSKVLRKMRGILRKKMIVDKMVRDIRFQVGQSTANTLDPDCGNSRQRLQSPTPSANELPDNMRDLSVQELNKMSLCGQFEDNSPSQPPSPMENDASPPPSPKLPPNRRLIHTASAFLSAEQLENLPPINIIKDDSPMISHQVIHEEDQSSPTSSVSQDEEKENIRIPQQRMKHMSRLPMHNGRSVHGDELELSLEEELKQCMKDLDEDGSSEDGAGSSVGLSSRFSGSIELSLSRQSSEGDISISKPFPTDLNSPLHPEINTKSQLPKRNQHLNRMDTSQCMIVPPECRITPIKEQDENKL